MALDPVEQAIVAQSLIAAAQEMGVKLIRSAHSPIVREAEDCSAALLNADGAVVAQRVREDLQREKGDERLAWVLDVLEQLGGRQPLQERRQGREAGRQRLQVEDGAAVAVADAVRGRQAHHDGAAY